MIRRPFDFHAPTTLTDVLHLLSEYGAEAKLLAGGQSLVPVLNLGLSSPAHIVSLNRLRDLSYIREEGREVAIGALTCHRVVERSEVLKARCSILAETAGHIGDIQIRNRGTIGGSVCHFDPAADYPPVLLLLGARFRVAGPAGERVVEAKDYFVDYMTTCLRPDEILLEVRIPILPPGTGSAYTKLTRIEGGFAIVGVGAYLVCDPDCTCQEVRVGIGGATSVPLRLTAIEEVMQGRKVDEGFMNEVAEAAYDAAAQPTAELHAEGAYKREMVRVFTRRSLSTALARAVPV